MSLRGLCAAMLFDEMFHLNVPVLEKILRPVLVYLALILLLRVFGKRELAQLNQAPPARSNPRRSPHRID